MDEEQQLQDDAKEEARRKATISRFDPYIGATLKSVEDHLRLVLKDVNGSEFIVSWGYFNGKTSLALDDIAVPTKPGQRRSIMMTNNIWNDQDDAKEEEQRKQLSHFDRYLGATLQSVEDGLLVLKDVNGSEFVVSWGYFNGKASLTLDDIAVPED